LLTAPGWIPVADPTEEVPAPVGKGEDLVLFVNSLGGHSGLGVRRGKRCDLYLSSAT